MNETFTIPVIGEVGNHFQRLCVSGVVQLRLAIKRAMISRHLLHECMKYLLRLPSNRNREIVPYVIIEINDKLILLRRVKIRSNDPQCLGIRNSDVFLCRRKRYTCLQRKLISCEVRTFMPHNLVLVRVVESVSSICPNGPVDSRYARSDVGTVVDSRDEFGTTESSFNERCIEGKDGVIVDTDFNGLGRCVEEGRWDVWELDDLGP